MEPMEEEIDLPECHEGPEAYARFDTTMTAFLAVPKTTILRKQRAHRRKVDANPNRPGPKRKADESAPFPFDN